MSDETKSNEILDAINAFADHTEKELGTIKTEIQRINSQTINLVTKDYLDDKLADLRGDLVVLTRKEDKKVMALVDILKQRKLIDDADVKKILAMEPFPQSL